MGGEGDPIGAEDCHGGDGRLPDEAMIEMGGSPVRGEEEVWGGGHKIRPARGRTAPVWGYYSTDVLISQGQKRTADYGETANCAVERVRVGAAGGVEVGA
jgi:hypothetical protein